MAKGIDFKDLSLKYGEKVGFGVAALIMVSLIASAFSSPGENVTKDDIQKNAKTANDALISREVQEDKLIPAGVKSPKELDGLASNVERPIPANAFGFIHHMFIRVTTDDAYRRNPEVYTPTSLTGTSALFAFRTYVVKPPDVLIMERKDNKKPQAPPPNDNDRRGRDRLRGGGSGGRVPGAPGGGSGGAAPPPPPAPGAGFGRGRGNSGPQPPDLGGPAAGGDTGEESTVWVGKWKPVANLKDEDVLANGLFPARAALIEGGYPHALQMDEIGKAMRITNKADIPSLYKRLEVQRRIIITKGTKMLDGSVLNEDHVYNVVDRSLKPLSQVKDKEDQEGGWLAVDLNKIGETLRRAVEFAEEEDATRKQLMELSDRLVMKLPKPVRNKFPDQVGNLPEVEAAIKKIKEEFKGKVAPPRRDPRLGSSDFDPFGLGGEQAGQGGQGAGGERAGAGGGFNNNRPGGNQGGFNAPGGAGDNKPEEAVTHNVPDTCWVRFLDLDVPANFQTFEYRVRVVLQNPNEGRTEDVAVPEYAKVKELVGKWSKPCRVNFPEDAYVYTDERPGKEQAGEDEKRVGRDKIAVQVHKWLGVVKKSNGVHERVGEWWVDRILAGRGEYIGRSANAETHSVNVKPPAPKPGDKKDKDEGREGDKPKEAKDAKGTVVVQNPLTAGQTALIFWVATTPETEDLKKVGVDSLQQGVRTDSLLTDVLLIDFEGGMVEPRRFNLNGKNVTWQDDVPAEILTVEPDGRIIARSLLKDRDDKERKDRFTAWEKWFAKVKAETEKRAGGATAKPGGLFN